MKRPDKVVCEICAEKELSTLHYHHIIERTEKESTEHAFNLAIICSNCHNKIHAGLIEIVGIFPSTKKPYNRTLVYNEGSQKNKLDLDEPYFTSKPKSMKVYYGEE